MTDAPKEAPREIVFHYIKSNFFRVAFADGALVGNTPQGNVHFTVFSERTPFPQATVHQLLPNGGLAPGERRVGKEGIVREMEVDVVLSIDNAKLLAAALNDAVVKMEKQRAEMTR